MDENFKTETLRPFFIENISKFCDKCGTEYSINDIGIISETTSSVIIQAQCHKCKASYMAHIVKPLQMTKKVPIKLDISPMLIKKYYDMGPISADEVLSLRKKILKTKDIDSLTDTLGYENDNTKTNKPQSRRPRKQ